MKPRNCKPSVRSFLHHSPPNLTCVASLQRSAPGRPTTRPSRIGNYQHLRTHTCDTAIRRPDVQSLPTPADCFTDVIIIRYSTWQASRLRDSARIAFLAPCTQKPHTHVRAPPAQRTAQHAFTDCCDTHSHRYTTLLLTHRPTTQQPTQAKATNEDTARASPARLALRNEPRVRRTPGLACAVSELLLDFGLVQPRPPAPSLGFRGPAFWPRAWLAGWAGTRGPFWQGLVTGAWVALRGTGRDCVCVLGCGCFFGG